MHRNISIFFKLPVILLVILSFIVTVNTSAWRQKKLPEDNFVNIIMMKSVFIHCDDSDLDCTYPGEYMKLGGATATGFAVKSIDGSTFIITASHFCSSETGYERKLQSQNIETDITAFDIYGSGWSSKIVFEDIDLDLCLLESKIPHTKDIKLATAMPERGERIYSLSAPYGISAQNVVLQFEGFFSGCESNQRCFFTIPATSGSSGGLIFNDKNEIIGMIQMSTINFESIAIGPDISVMRDFLTRASRELDTNLL